MKHGSRTTYDKLGCRCDLCREASTKAKRVQRDKYRSDHGIPPVIRSNDKGRKIAVGDVRTRRVNTAFGSSFVGAVTVDTLGPGDTVEITYGADEIVIRRAGLTSPPPAVP